MAITISKALPIISEAVSVVSGTTSMTFKNFLYYSIAGHFIVSVIYAYAGSLSSEFNSNLVAALIIVLALFAGWIMQFMMRRRAGNESELLAKLVQNVEECDATKIQ